MFSGVARARLETLGKWEGSRKMFAGMHWEPQHIDESHAQAADPRS